MLYKALERELHRFSAMPQLMKHRNKLENGAWSNGSDVNGIGKRKVSDRSLVFKNLMTIVRKMFATSLTSPPTGSFIDACWWECW